MTTPRLVGPFPAPMVLDRVEPRAVPGRQHDWSAEMVPRDGAGGRWGDPGHRQEGDDWRRER